MSDIKWIIWAVWQIPPAIAVPIKEPRTVKYIICQLHIILVCFQGLIAVRVIEAVQYLICYCQTSADIKYCEAIFINAMSHSFSELRIVHGLSLCIEAKILKARTFIPDNSRI